MSASKSYCYEFPRPAVTVDAVILTYISNEVKVLLINRAGEPFSNHWAFPGGFINENETAEIAVRRELQEETGVNEIKLEQFYTTTAPERDPRGWTISVVFFGCTSSTNLNLKAGDDAREVAWHPINALPELAFDHDILLKTALDTIRTKMRLASIAFRMLQKSFSKHQFITLGKSLGYAEGEISQRFQRFLRVRLLLSAAEKDMYSFNEENLKQIS